MKFDIHCPKQMRGKMQRKTVNIVIIVALGALVLSACGSSAGKATSTPTLSIEEISTSVAETVIAQITEQAPTITLTPVFTDTPVFTPTLATPLPTKTAPRPTSSNCANMTYVADVTIPDGTQMPVGQEFTKTWRVQNSGTCPWTTSFKLVFAYGEAMSGQGVTMPATVAVGQQIDISVKLKVPNKTGSLTGFWTMMDDKNQPFAKLLTVVINVGTVSPTPTGSVTATPTMTTGATAIPSNTAAPSETPSETLTATP